jgi:hypothetical protein
MPTLELPAIYRDAAPHAVEGPAADVDRSEVLRYLGYPAGHVPHLRIQPLLDQWIAEGAALAAPRAAYRVFPVHERTAHWIDLQSQPEATRFRGAIGEFLGPARWVAVFVATAGPAVECLAGDLLAAGDAFGALVVSAVAAERAEAAEATVLRALHSAFKPLGVAPTLPYSPGYCGMALTEQRPLFALLGDATAGVELTEACVMRPLKSVSGLVGLGPAELVRAGGSPCDRCDMRQCSMRREWHEGDPHERT